MKLIANPNGNYSAVLGTGDRQKRIRLHCRTLAEAKERAAQLNLERIEQLAISDVITRELIHKLTIHGAMTVETAVLNWYAWMQAAYESKNTAFNRLSCARTWMKQAKVTHRALSEVTENDIDAWINQEDGCKASHRRFKLSVIRNFFKFCALKGYITANIAELVRVKHADLDHGQLEARVKRCFTEEEYQKVLFTIRAEIDRLASQVDEAPRAFYNTYRFWFSAVIIGRHSALRLGDIAGLQWASFANGRLIVHTDKRNVRVDQEITPELQIGLQSIARNQSKFCFPLQHAISRHPETRAQLSVQFNRILKKAGVIDQHFHNLRITKISELDSGGKDLAAIARFAGHTSTKSTEGYIVK